MSFPAWLGCENLSGELVGAEVEKTVGFTFVSGLVQKAMGSY